MGQPVVHFEIIGRDPATLRTRYGELFGWEFQAALNRAESLGGKRRMGPEALPETSSSGSSLTPKAAGSA